MEHQPDDPEDEDRVIYFNSETNPETFQAICRAVYKNVSLCMAIGYEARE